MRCDAKTPAFGVWMSPVIKMTSEATAIPPVLAAVGTAGDAVRDHGRGSDRDGGARDRATSDDSGAGNATSCERHDQAPSFESVSASTAAISA